MGNKRAGETKQQFVIVNICDRQTANIANLHNSVGADIIRPRNPYNPIAAYFVGVGDPDDPLTRERHDMNLWDLHPTFTSYYSQTFYIFRVSAFSFYLKKKTPAKEKQTQGCAPRPCERRAAVLSSRLSISCSAHSRANAPELERVRARASCFASRSLACLN